MANDTSTPDRTAPVTSTVADDAVGVPDAHWFVAIVNHNNELNVLRHLTTKGYTAYVASQQEKRIRANGRRVTVDRLVIPSKVFIHCTEQQRRHLVTLPYINRFMTDRASRADGTTRSPLVTIPDHQMQTMRFMLGHSDAPVAITDFPLQRGTEVEVVRGSLKGLCGEICEAPDGTHSLTVRLDLLGCARVTISPLDVRPLNH